MSTEPSEIRAQIEQTRSNLSDTVDALADQANPVHVARREVSKVRGKLRGFLDRIVGSAQDAADTTVGAVQRSLHDTQGSAQGLMDRASSVGDAVADAPRAIRHQTEGSPLTAGVVAFGLGLLVAAAFPPSRKEQELALAAKEQAQPVTEQFAAAGKEMAENLAEPARQAVDSLKESATQAVRHVQDEGKDAIADVQDTAGESAGTVAEAARPSGAEGSGVSDSPSGSNRS